MDMPYITNPFLPRVRMEAVRFVRSGKSTREAADKFGVNQSTIVRWTEKAPVNLRLRVIPTRSSRPHHHPKELDPVLVAAILRYRSARDECAFVLHHRLVRDGYRVSLSSVKRTLQRNELTRFSRWKKWHTYPPRPTPEKPGMLVEIDTIHDGPSGDQFYIYTLLDVCSRWAYATPSLHINTHKSLEFVGRAQEAASFSFATLQSDHGSEFSKWFTTQVRARGIAHRHSRIRTPNDNAHLERFNRTIQEGCIARIPRSLRIWRREIPEYLRYYNTERPHMGLGMKTPLEVMRRY
jgi:transposase InsO family protein